MEPVRNSEQPEYTHFYSNAGLRPFSVTRLRCEAARVLGYPIQFKDGATDLSGQPLAEHVRVMMDSRETAEKYSELRTALDKSPATVTSRNIEDASAYAFYWALHNDPLINQVGLRELANVDEELLKRSFIAAYDLQVAKIKERPDGKYFTPPSPEETAYYMSIKDEVPAIEEEGMVGWMLTEMRAYLKDHPELKPRPRSDSAPF